MGKPAARITDMHTCPMVDPGPKPHVGGPIVVGEPTVIIAGMPAARVGDQATCVGPLDSIAMGSTTVRIGYKFAARLGDTTSHGGVIVTGAPTVLIGGAVMQSRSVTTSRSGGFWGALVGAVIGAVVGAVAGLIVSGPVGTIAGGIAGAVVGAAIGYSLTSTEVTQFGPSIVIEGTPQYRTKVVRDLRVIENTPSGQALLESMESSNKTARIHADDPSAPGNWAWTDPQPSGTNPPGYLKADGTQGAAANTEIGYNPDRTSLSGPPGSPYNNAAWAQPPNRPADVGLFHEMVHADDMMHGRLDGTNGVNTGPRAGQPLPNSELRAVGLPPHGNAAYSENSYRRDRGLPERTFY